jgi:hypothetical protein
MKTIKIISLADYVERVTSFPSENRKYWVIPSECTANPLIAMSTAVSSRDTSDVYIWSELAIKVDYADANSEPPELSETAVYYTISGPLKKMLRPILRDLGFLDGRIISP